MHLFQQAEQGFDKLFNYNRQQSESFDYRNTIKNSSISEQLELQELHYQGNQLIGEKKREVQTSIEIKIDNSSDCKHENKQY